ncbi:MAG TPA: family 16 glycoside hydrolase, partial [Planctomycetota bacterium]|nr:family 16 glycoside hydrolase [Planctomycetota bacterium]
LALALGLWASAQAGDGGDNLSALVQILKSSDDADFQLDILKGIRDGLKGRTTVKMPQGWEEVSTRLAKSSNPDVRAIAQALSTTFGDPKALKAMRDLVADPKGELAARKSALETLLGARDAGLPPVLQVLLKDPGMRADAIRGLGTYEDPKTPELLLEVYSTLETAEKRDVLNTLVARLSYARHLLGALKNKIIPRTEVTAATIRQLHEYKDPEMDKWIDAEWGMMRTSPEAKLKEIADWKKFLQSQPKGDPSKGRALFSKTCQQCHTLFDTGGKVGPEITGANRSDLHYLLENIIDPSAVVAKDYMAVIIRTKNGRIVTGIIKAEDGNAITLATENDLLVIPKPEIDAMKQSEISMMPEGQLNTMSKDDVRHLIAYLMSPVQVPMGALPQTTVQIFNGKDLTDWEGDPAVWSVEGGEVVGKGALKRNSFLFHTKEYSDFRLTAEIKLVPNGGNSGFQIRSVPIEGGEARGPQADVGAGWWGKLYEESARGVLYPAKGQEFDGDKFVNKDDWNVYEIVAVGPRIRTAINGHLCTDLDDPKVSLKGRFGLQVHSGGMMEVRFRNFKLELNPAFELKTLK